MAGTIRVDTEELWEAARRYERLAADMEESAVELGAVHGGLDAAYSRDDFLMRLETIRLKTSGIAGSLRGLGGKLRFAANHYEEFDRDMKKRAGAKPGVDAE